MSFAGAIEAGKAFVAFGVDTTKFERGLKRLQGRMKTFGVSLQAQSAAISTSLAFSALPFVAATKVFADLEEKLTFVAAAAGKNLSEIPKVTEAVRKLGRTTSFTASEVADAALAMARAGVAARDIPKALESVVAFSKATQLEMGRAAEVVTDTLNAFGLSFDKAGKAVDILTKTANSSSQTMEQLAEALSYTAPQAAALGVSLEDTTELLGLLANSSIKASIAGTGLQRIMINMGKAAQQAKFKDLGIETVDKATGQVRSLADIIVDLNKVSKLKNLNDLEKANLFNELFGRGSKAALILARQVGNTSESFEKFKQKINSAKSATEIQAELMKTTAGRLQIMKSAILETADAIGSAFTAAISGAVVPISRMSEDISAWFRNNTALGSSIVGVIAGGLALTAAMFTLGTALRLIAFTVTPALSAALWTLSGTMKIVAATAAAVKATFLLITTGARTGMFATIAFNTALIALKVTFLAVKFTALALGGVFTALTVASGAAAIAMGATAAVPLAPFIAVAAIVGGIIAAFKLFPSVLGKAKSVLLSVFGKMKASVMAFLDIWKGFFDRVFESGNRMTVAFKTGDLKLMFDKAWNELRYVLDSFVVSLAESLPGFLGGIDEDEAADFQRRADNDLALRNQQADVAKIVRDEAKSVQGTREGAKAEVADAKDRVINGDLLDAEKIELNKAAIQVKAAMRTLADPTTIKDIEASRKAQAKVEAARAKLAAAQQKIDERVAREKAEVQADLAGTGSEDTPEGRAAKEQAAADARQKLNDLELRQKKNQMEIEKKRAGNIGSFERNLTGPSSTDLRSASGFNSLLTAQNNIVATSIENLELAVREENLKMQELLIEQNKLSADIKKQNEEVDTLDAELVP